MLAPMQIFKANAPLLNTDETPRAAPAVVRPVTRPNGWLRPAFAAIPSAPRLMTVGYSLADQALAVGGMFLVNVMLARTQTKEEYGIFALSYSLFTFLAGVHNASILEPYTVYGSGRYRDRFREYLRLMTRANVLLGLLLSGVLLLTCLGLWWMAPQFASLALLGLGLTVGVLLSGLFLRRTFYVQRQPAFAAKSSLVFFVTVGLGLWLAVRAQVLNTLSAFLVLALAWVVAGACFARKLPFGRTQVTFLDLEPGYWRVHWKYARWVLSTAFVFQLTAQGYYWLVAGLLSVKEVGELRAMYNLIAPVDQVIVALSFLVLPAMASHYAMKRMDHLLSLWKRYVLAVLGVTALFALSLRILGQQVMHLLYAGKFDGLGPLVFALALLPVLTATGTTMSQALSAVEKPKLVFYSYVTSGAATFALGIPLVIHFGLRGAVYGMLLSAAAFNFALGLGFLVAVLDKARR
jgi:O-antigen/teichoic acid export membrane protein